MEYPDIASLADELVLDLTTVGRHSGEPRTIEIWFVYHQGKLYLNAEHGHSTQWVRNLLQNPRVQVCLREWTWDGHARVLNPNQDRQLWVAVVALSRQKYGWGEGLPVEITPTGVSPGS
jgi:deazaflavin-dependent oxidoreductase (nitroreductase family)